MDSQEVKDLQIHAAHVRKMALEAVHSAGAGHPGGSLSVADILTYLYFKAMNVDPADAKNPDRDRFVLSKGHCSPALYGILAERGFIPKEDIKGFRSIDSYLQGHPDMKKINGVDMSTGSLGQGISCANGMALAGKLDGKDYRVYTALGDGEIEEGQVWEAAMTSAHYKLDNLCVIVDNNKLQIDGSVEEVMSVYPIKEKFESFGFEVFEVDGNNIDSLITVFQKAKTVKGKPTVIVAKTIKGKGISFMENQVGWHGKAPSEEQYLEAMKEVM